MGGGEGGVQAAGGARSESQGVLSQRASGVQSENKGCSVREQAVFSQRARGVELESKRCSVREQGVLS